MNTTTRLRPAILLSLALILSGCIESELEGQGSDHGDENDDSSESEGEDTRPPPLDAGSGPVDADLDSEPIPCVVALDVGSEVITACGMRPAYFCETFAEHAGAVVLDPCERACVRLDGLKCQPTEGGECGRGFERWACS